MFYTQEPRPKKRFGLIATFLIVLSLALGAVATYTIVKINEPERVPGRIIEKTAVEYNVNNDAEVIIANNNLISTVSIEVRGNGEIYSGTGFIVDFIQDTYKYPVIMTNYHVIGKAATNSRYDIKIKLFEKANFFKTDAEIIGYDSEIDIAVLKLPVDFKDAEHIEAVEFGNSRNLKYGQKVVAIGNALGGGLSVTSGEISIPEVVETVTLTEGSNANNTTQHFIQTSAAINSGNSGGILLDMTGNGRVIGINTYKVIADNITSGDTTIDIPADNIGLAVPSNMARAILDYIKAESNNYIQGISDVANMRKFALNFETLVPDIDDDFNNVLKAQTTIDLGLGFFNNLSEDDIISHINGIEISRFHTGMPYPSASIFAELELYYGTAMDTGLQENEFYQLTLTIDNERTYKIPNMYLQREIPWIQDFLQ